MSRYEYIDHALANYFASEIGHSEEEAIRALRSHMAASPELANGLRTDVQQATVDDTYSWQEVLAEFDVLTASDEEEAAQYARKLFDAVLGEAQ